MKYLILKCVDEIREIYKWAIQEDYEDQGNDGKIIPLKEVSPKDVIKGKGKTPFYFVCGENKRILLIGKWYDDFPIYELRAADKGIFSVFMYKDNEPYRYFRIEYDLDKKKDVLDFIGSNIVIHEIYEEKNRS